MATAGRLLHSRWDLYDTRHTVFRPARMTPEALEAGYWRAYERFYRWTNIPRGAATKPTLRDFARHAAYAGGWKKLEPLWDMVIRARRIAGMRPVLEGVLTGFGRLEPAVRPPAPRPATAASAAATATASSAPKRGLPVLAR